MPLIELADIWTATAAALRARPDLNTDLLKAQEK
jgi:hypothetical protein